MAQTQTIPKLSAQDKKRLLILTQLTDLVVPMHLMYIDGVRHYRSFALGHTGGFAAHFFADRDLIADFARTQQG